MYNNGRLCYNVMSCTRIPCSEESGTEVHMRQENNTMMRDLPARTRPYERCLESGPEVLSDLELLAVLLRSGTQGCSALELARKVLKLCPYEEGLGGLSRLTLPDLQQLPGIGPVKAVQICCAGELAKRIARKQHVRRPQFRDAFSIAEYYMENLRHCEQEHVFGMMLDTRNRLLGEEEISRGTVNQSLFSPRELFLKALSYHAVHVILIHNHPSGEAEPSREDLEITKKTFEAGELIGITLLDHIIVGDQCYTSLRNEHAELFGTDCADS